MSTSTAQHDARFRRAAAVLCDGIAQGAFPGAVFAVTVDGQLAACRSVGRLTYHRDSPEVTPETLFDLASLTKVLATTPMAMLLYEHGEMDLDTPVAGVLPEFGREQARGDVTIRMLLAHTSGLPAYVRLFEQARTRQELVAAACRTPLVTLPGERTEYSDIGFIILGELLQRIADEPIDSFCRREVFGPLGMSQTCFNPPAALRPGIPPTEDDREFRHRVIQGEVHDENASVMGGISGHAGLFSPAGDVARLAQCMLNAGAPVFRAASVNLFAGAQPARQGVPRALGWDLPSSPSQSGRFFSSRSFGHLGFTGTSLWIDEARRVSVTLLSNRTWPDRRSQEIKRLRPAFHDAVMEALGFGAPVPRG